VHVNISLADTSNSCLLAAVVLYALGMLAYACDFAFAKTRLMPEAAPAMLPELVSVGAIASASAGASSAAAGSAGASNATAASSTAASAAANGAGSPGQAAALGGLPSRAERWPTGFWLRAAFGLTCVGVVTQMVAILTRGLSEHRVPWGNMYEFIAAITCMAVIVLVVASVRFRAYYIGLFVLIPVVFALALDVTVIYTPAGQLVPALQSYWIAIHVTAMIVACGLYIVGAVVTVMYLIADRNERRIAAGLPSRSAGIMVHLPRPVILDRLSYRSILFAFPVWTFGVMAGAIWADHAWGRYWGWDPKETWSFITWVVYACFLHARATAGWRGRRAAYIHLAGFACLMFNLIGINLLVTGLHSYAGLS
jgi:cytochrome c-type biogenesis protein CcsB